MLIDAENSKHGCKQGCQNMICHEETSATYKCTQLFEGV